MYSFVPRWVFIVFFIGVLGIPSSGRSESIFSINGLGESIYGATARSMGMGTVTLGVADDQNLSVLNPALSSLQSLTTASFTYQPERYAVQDAVTKTHFNGSLFPHFKLSIPLPSRYSMSLGYVQETDYDYLTSKTFLDEDEPYRSDIEGSGGLYSVRLSVAGKWQRLAFGLGLKYYFGTTDQTWYRDFANPDFVDSEDHIQAKITGMGMYSGFLWRLHDDLALGGIYAPKATLDQETEITAIYSTEPITQQHEATIPSQYGVGAYYKAMANLKVAADMVVTNWSEFEINGKQSHQLEYIDTARFSVGVEYLPSIDPRRNYFLRMPLRAGYYTQPYYYKDADGDKIREHFFSIGWGMPLKGRFGIVDVAVQWGKRGSVEPNTVEETITRIAISISGSEKWGKRRKWY
ncbi:MAG: hypothetical protein D6675_15775 [Gemmatimonadetes bacterium]|nr:MAG: hypothetical protein D6675_15775 [Gemmatimonadota bacterium]